ncbi:hypothetical protein C1H46_033351 [Malus baccata]|uniref:Uncharacterized protein n=1 Tax=Malus baccata TaxID=106549 RepID=A0A540L4D3_MALBA|nr:hypothetical protein C1H46_033351 [Malus baccata]
MANPMLDDDGFLAYVETQPHSQFGAVAPNESFATYQPHETCSGYTGRREKLNFNRFGQAISPRDNVARFGHYVTMLARDGELIPIDSLNWWQIDSSKLDRVWLLVQATINWTNPRAAGKEEKVKGVVETKLHDHTPIYVEVVGPKKRNQVRGFGLGVAWADVPGIVTKQRGISREVKYLIEAYEAHKQAIAAAEEKVTRMMHEANEKAENMKREQEESIQRLRVE